MSQVPQPPPQAPQPPPYGSPPVPPPYDPTRMPPPQGQAPPGGPVPGPSGDGQGRDRLAVTAFAVGLASLALCPPVGVAAIVLGIMSLRRIRAAGVTAGRALARGAVVAGVVAVLFSVGLVWFWEVAVSDSGTVITDVNSLPRDGRCDEARFVADPDC